MKCWCRPQLAPSAPAASYLVIAAPLVLAPTFHEKELRVVGSSDGWDYQEHARWYFDVVRGHSYNLEQIFNYHTTVGELAATFEGLATGAIIPTKVLVRYDTIKD